MARRRSVSTDDSLELLLDTVCNAFGAIVFMAILLTILVRNAPAVVSQHAQPTNVQADTDSAQERLRLEAELRIMQLAAEVHSAGEAAKLDPSWMPLFQEAENLETEAKSLSLALEADRKKLEELKLREQAAKSSAAERENERSELETRLKSAEERLNRELDQAVRMAESPRLRPTRKSERPVLLFQGRLYASLSDWTVARRGADSVVELMPGAGTVISTQENWKAELSMELQASPSAEYYVGLAVWADSFDEFQAVRQYIVELGYEYRLVLLRVGEKLYVGSSEPPLVQ